MRAVSWLVLIPIAATICCGGQANELRFEPEPNSADGIRKIRIVNLSTNASYFVVLDSAGRLPSFDSPLDAHVRLVDELPLRREGYFCIKLNPSSDKAVDTIPWRAEDFPESCSTESLFVVRVVKSESRTPLAANAVGNDGKGSLDGEIRFKGTNAVCRIWNNGEQSVLLRMNPKPSVYNRVSFRPGITATGQNGECVLLTGHGMISDGGSHSRYYYVLPPRTQMRDCSPPCVEWTSPLPKNMDGVFIRSCSAEVIVTMLSLSCADEYNGMISNGIRIEYVKLRFVGTDSNADGVTGDGGRYRPNLEADSDGKGGGIPEGNLIP